MTNRRLENLVYGTHRAWALIALLAAPVTSFGVCMPSNPALQSACLNEEAQQRAQQEAQQRAQQEAQQRAQQDAQQRAQQEAQQRAQQEAQQRAQQEAQQRAQEQARARAAVTPDRASSSGSNSTSHSGNSSAATAHTPSVGGLPSSVHTPGAAGLPPPEHIPSVGGLPSSVHTPGVAGLPPAEHIPSVGGLPSSVHTPGVAGLPSSGTIRPAATQNSEAHPNLTSSSVTPGGRQVTLRSDGTLRTLTAHGQSASFLANGHLASLHTGKLDVVHDVHGGRTVVVHGPDHSLIVSTGAHRGYVQKAIFLHGQRFIQRTILAGRTRTVRLYSSYTFHGVVLTHYMPHYLYAPAFYGWAYYPWAAPVPYVWAWAAAPWYAAYGPYFVTSPVYAGPYDWLTDYYLGQTLADAYTASQPDGGETADATQGYADQAAGAAPGDELSAQSDAPISPEVKQAIAQEVQQQIAYENAASAQPETAATVNDLPQILQPNHVFVVDAGLNATTPDAQACTLSAGDVLRLTAAPAADSAVADLIVTSSRRADCPAGVQVALSLENLEEMQNSFRARLDDGLLALRGQQGHNGLPTAPPSAIAPPPRPTEYPPAADDNTDAMLSSARQQAAQAETEVTQQALAANSKQ
jgi:hypothetical protein